MKKFIIAAIICVTPFAKSLAQKAKTFTINGTIANVQNTTISFTPLGEKVGDTIKVKNGSFTFKGSVKEPTAYVFLSTEGLTNLIFVEGGNHTLEIGKPSSNEFVISNSPAQDDINKFINNINPLIQKRASFAAMQANDSINLARQQNEVDIQNVYNSYIRNPKSNPVTTAFLTLNNIQNTQGMGLPQMEALATNLSTAAKATNYGKKIAQIIGRHSADEMGKVAPDFTLLDSAGKPITLSQFKGKKYVLVDFWATWCGPCRGEFPHLKAAYEKYSSKDLVILGVSIDADKKKWQTMIGQKDYCPWLHVYDPPGANQVANTLYTVPSIPRNFLIDKNGVVIAKNLRGAAIDAQLEKLLK